jgi:peptidoglycan/LPS O-acetylase OafA/YrhL
MVFFVLSGYLVGSSVLRADFGRWSWRWYLNRRLTRLWIVLIPAIVLCALVDHLGMVFFGIAGIYTHGQNTAGIITGSVQSRDTVPIALGNIAFLQTIRVPTFGSDSALWSLANEFWYYLLFPLALILVRGKAVVTKVLAAAIGCAILLLVGQTIALYFAIWLFGAAIAILPPFILLRKRAVWRTSVMVSIVACLGGLVYSHSRTGELGDVIVGAVFSVLIYLIVSVPHESLDDRTTKRGVVATRLAAFSFTIYLVHLPLLVFIRAGTQHHGIPLWQPTILHIGTAALIAVVVVSVAYGFSLGTEAQTDRARSWIGRVAREPNISPSS